MSHSDPYVTIGVLGAGQLGRMLALSGYALGYRFRFFDPAEDATSGRLAPLVNGQYDDQTLLKEFAVGLDVVTYEFENVPVESAILLNKMAPVYPPVEALRVSQDRYVEKSYLAGLGITTANFISIESLIDLQIGVTQVGLPCVLKTRRMGYDGKGQIVLRTRDDIWNAWTDMQGNSLILEQYVPFDYEVSMVAARNAAGDTCYYPLTHNTHRDGILRTSIPQVVIDKNHHEAHLQLRAQQYTARVLDDLHYVGVLAIEFFVVNGTLVANEVAPRVHNSGHWSIEGAVTSQFENHIRAITGLSLGSSELTGFSAMVNIIGELPDIDAVLAVPHAHIHLYDKEPRPGRKIGHVTIQAPNAVMRDEELRQMKNILRRSQK